MTRRYGHDQPLLLGILAESSLVDSPTQSWAGGLTDGMDRFYGRDAGFNLSLLMCHLFGIGKPRTLQNASAALLYALLRFWSVHLSTRTLRTAPRQPPWEYSRLWMAFAQPRALKPKVKCELFNGLLVRKY